MRLGRPGQARAPGPPARLQSEPSDSPKAGHGVLKKIGIWPDPGEPGGREAGQLAEFARQMRLICIAVPDGEYRPVGVGRSDRIGGERAEASLAGQQFRPESDMPGEAAFKLADAEVHLVCQPLHR